MRGNRNRLFLCLFGRLGCSLLFSLGGGWLFLGGCFLSPSDSVRNLGIYFDPTLSFSSHISRLISTCFYQLRCIRSCIRSLPRSAALTVINSFVISRLDYCNSLFVGLPDSQLIRLQRVLNTAARLLSRTSKFQSITPLHTCVTHSIGFLLNGVFSLSLPFLLAKP